MDTKMYLELFWGGGHQIIVGKSFKVDDFSLCEKADP